VRRQVQEWKVGHRGASEVFIPLHFEPGEAFQFDWGEETLILGGRTTKVSIAHVRLCHSRLPICVAYVRESLEMVMDAHRQTFAFFGGACRRGIYDNMKTVVTKILLLDEPTNDLDVNTLRALEEALESFAGCAVVVSHDRWFLDRIATHILAFEEDGSIRWFEGNFSDYEADRKKRLGNAADMPHRIRHRKLQR